MALDSWQSLDHSDTRNLARTYGRFYPRPMSAVRAEGYSASVTDPIYWLDLFTPETCREVGKIDYSVSGFRANRKAVAKKIKLGDQFLCYLTGKSRFVGVFDILGGSYFDETPIWKSDSFPVRFKTRLVVKVPEDRGLHLHEVIAQSSHARSWSGYYRGSPNRLPIDDGRFIVSRLHQIASQTQESPAEEPVELDIGDDQTEEKPTQKHATRDHARIQHRLLKLGRDLGYQLWVASNDRSVTYDGERFGDMSVKELPVRFDDTTHKTIERIDVLWLQRNRIEAAFEIESTTSIYSGLLRMADLLAMQPNIEVPLFIVAPDEKRNAVFREIRRPVFSSLQVPLAKACRYISFQQLEDELDALGARTKHLRPSFLNDLAELAS
jgi:hypothetical protein